MEKELMNEIKDLILKNFNDISNVSMYINIEGDYVIKYIYENQEYMINIIEL